MFFRTSILLAVVLAVVPNGLCPPKTSAALLRVDLDQGSSATQPGFDGWFLASGDSGPFAADFSKDFSYGLAVGGSLDVTMTTGGQTYTRRYAAVTAPPAAVAYNQLLRDMLFFNQKTVDGTEQGNPNFFQVRLDHLLAGSYEFTGWHNGTSYLAGHATTDILLSVGEDDLVDTGLKAALIAPGTVGSSVLPGDPSTSSIRFHVPNDGDSVIIRYANPTDRHFGLNGFQLVPEPGTWMLLLWGAAWALMARRRK